MTGLAKKVTKQLTEREAILQAMKTPPEAGYFVWDGKDEDDRPATAQELAGAVRRGRPSVATVRPMVSLRMDADVATALRASGKGWQTRVNALLRQAVEQGRLRG
jgi:uncharacterized protein (DUF4415 family)